MNLLPKKALFSALIAGAFFVGSALAEEITLNTYYPSPAVSTANVRSDNAAIGSTFKNQTPPADGLIVQGEVGIGTTTPAARLHVHDPSAVDTYFHITNSASGMTSRDGLDLVLHNNGLDANLWNWENGYIRFGTNNIERVRITNTGNVGIGKSDPSVSLHVVGTGEVDQIRIGTSASSKHAFLSSFNASGAVTGYFGASRNSVDFGGELPARAVGVISTGADNPPLVFLTGHPQAKARVTIANNGNVGIGTASPASILHVAKTGQLSATLQTAGPSDGSTWTALVFQRSRGTIAAPTNVADGDVLGTVTAMGYSNGWPSNGPQINFVADGAVTAGHIPPSRIAFYTSPPGGGATEAMRISRNGNVGIGTPAPSGKLHIQGEKVFITSSPNGPGLYIGEGGGLNQFGIIHWNAEGDKRLMIGVQPNTSVITIPLTGNVGIGTTDPTLAKLQVENTGGVGVYGKGSSATSGYGGWFIGGVAGISAEGPTGVSAKSTATNGPAVSGLATGTGGVGVSGAATGSGGVGVRGFASAGTTNWDFYAAGGASNYGPFTGAHEAKIIPGEKIERGMIVSVTGEVAQRTNPDGSVSLSSTLPTVRPSSASNDPAVFGVFTGESDTLPEGHWYSPQLGDRFATVNALGEGRLWVTDVNGEIKNGDLITTSPIPGYGQRQADDLFHSYTVAKVTEQVDWSKVHAAVEYQGKKYKKHLIAVTYHSG